MKASPRLQTHGALSLEQARDILEPLLERDKGVFLSDWQIYLKKRLHQEGHRIVGGPLQHPCIEAALVALVDGRSSGEILVLQALAKTGATQPPAAFAHYLNTCLFGLSTLPQVVSTEHFDRTAYRLASFFAEAAPSLFLNVSSPETPELRLQEYNQQRSPGGHEMQRRFAIDFHLPCVRGLQVSLNAIDDLRQVCHGAMSLAELATATPPQTLATPGPPPRQRPPRL